DVALQTTGAPVRIGLARTQLDALHVLGARDGGRSRQHGNQHQAADHGVLRCGSPSAKACRGPLRKPASAPRPGAPRDGTRAYAPRFPHDDAKKSGNAAMPEHRPSQPEAVSPKQVAVHFTIGALLGTLGALFLVFTHASRIHQLFWADGTTPE